MGKLVKNYDYWVCSYNRKMLLDGYSVLEASLYGLIRFATQDDERIFFATDEYLAEFFQCGESTISRAIKNLAKNGAIGKHTYRKGSQTHREMWIADREKYNPRLGI